MGRAPCAPLGMAYCPTTRKARTQRAEPINMARPRSFMPSAICTMLLRGDSKVHGDASCRLNRLPGLQVRPDTPLPYRLARCTDQDVLTTYHLHRPTVSL